MYTAILGVHNKLKNMKKDSEVVTNEQLISLAKETQKSLPTNPTNSNVLKLAAKTIEKLEELRGKNYINVNLEIPSEFISELRKGSIGRHGGVLRNRKNQRIVKHLKEAKPSNIKKAIKVSSIAFLTVEVLEDTLLDEKLKEILDAVTEIGAKLDAQNKGRLRAAILQMSELKQIDNPELQKQSIPIIRNELTNCQQLFIQLYDHEWQKYEKLKSKFLTSRFYNKTELRKMSEIGQKIPEYLEYIILCKLGQIELYKMQDQYQISQEKAFEMLSFLTERIEEFKNEFSPTSISEIRHKIKDPIDFKKERIIIELNEDLSESNISLEHRLNTSLCYLLTIPQEGQNTLETILRSART